MVASSTIIPFAAIPQPENGGGALTLDIPLTDSVLMQHVYLTVDTNHTYAGDLEIILTSPSGTQSVLATIHTAVGAQLSGGFTFSSMRYLDEDSAGTWTVQIQDNLEADTGSISSVKLEVFGCNTVIQTISRRYFYRGTERHYRWC